MSHPCLLWKSEVLRMAYIKYILRTRKTAAALEKISFGQKQSNTPKLKLHARWLRLGYAGVLIKLNRSSALPFSFRRLTGQGALLAKPRQTIPPVSMSRNVDTLSVRLSNLVKRRCSERKVCCTGGKPPNSRFVRKHILQLAPYTPIVPFEVLSGNSDDNIYCSWKVLLLWLLVTKSVWPEIHRATWPSRGRHH